MNVRIVAPLELITTVLFLRGVNITTLLTTQYLHPIFHISVFVCLALSYVVYYLFPLYLVSIRRHYNNSQSFRYKTNITKAKLSMSRLDGSAIYLGLRKRR